MSLNNLCSAAYYRTKERRITLPQNILTIEEIQKTLPTLKADFEEAYGKGSATEHFITGFHGLKIIQDDEYNRKAQLPLMAYFMSLALGKEEELSKLKEAFIYYASKPVEEGGPIPKTNPNFILSTTHTYVSVRLRKNASEYSEQDFPEDPNNDGHANSSSKLQKMEVA